MKSIILILLFMTPIVCLSQALPPMNNIPVDSTTNLIAYKSIIKMPKASTDQIYAKVRAWLAVTYNSANNVLQMDDKASGTLIAKGIFSYPNLQFPSFVYYILTVNIKPEKFRITITNYTFTIGGSNSQTPLENMYRGFKKGMPAKDEIDFNIQSQLINMLNDVDYKSNSILKTASDFIDNGKKDDF